MTIQKTIQIGNPILRTICNDVIFPLSIALDELIVDLTETMRTSRLVGLAAPQLNKNARIFTMEIPHIHEDDDHEVELFVCINPKIVNHSGDIVYGNEGCGSIALGRLFGSIPRPAWCEVEYYDETGNMQLRRFEGLHSRVVLHEIDHLNGILFLDRMDDPKELFDTSEYKHATAEQG